MTDKPSGKNFLNLIFTISLGVKALDSVLEVMAGSLLIFTGFQSLNYWAIILTRPELAEDPQDLIANFFLKLVQSISVTEKNFIIIYLISHGLLKLFLIWGIFRKKSWAYPGLIGLLLVFGIYEFYRFSHVHAIYLFYLASFDIFLAILTYLEHLRLKRSRQT
jgi:uncharacterized membrane protein